MFKVNNNANINGTSLKGYVTCSFKDLVKKFGMPIDDDGYKVSGCWIFENDQGDVFTVYDWKMTELYDGQGLSVQGFRELPNYKFHVGGNGDATDFIDWLKTEV